MNCGALAGESHRERAVRPRARCVHRREHDAKGSVRVARARARSSSTRSASCRRRRRPSSCACWRNVRSSRVGATHPIAVPARVIAATHRELEKDVAAGSLPAGSAFPPRGARGARSAAARSAVRPPRAGDHILAATCERFGMRRKSMTAGALELLAAYDWRRNNVRELRNVIERMLIAADGDVIGADHVPAEIVGSRRARVRARRRRRAPFSSERPRRSGRSSSPRSSATSGTSRRTAQDLGLADHASLLKIMRRHGLSSR